MNSQILNDQEFISACLKLVKRAEEQGYEDLSSDNWVRLLTLAWEPVEAPFGPIRVSTALTKELCEKARVNMTVPEILKRLREQQINLTVSYILLHSHRGLHHKISSISL